MKSSTNFPDALLPHVQDRKVADVVFSRTSGGAPHDAVTVAGGLSDELAFRHYKGDLKKAITVVRATKSPEVLAKFAKDPRVNVRRAVAESPYVDAATATYLHTWAVAKNENDTLVSILPKTPWDTARATIPEEYRHSRYPWMALAQSCVAEGTVEAFESAKQLNNLMLSRSIGKILATNCPETYSLRQFLSGMDESVQGEVLVASLSNVRTLTLEHMNLVEQVEQHVEGAVQSHRLLPNIRMVDKDAIDAVLNSRLELLWIALAETAVSPAVMHRLIKKNSPAVAEVLSRKTHRALTSLMVERMAPAVAKGGQAWAIVELLNDPKVKVSSETALLLLRAGTFETTMVWLRGELARRPYLGEVTALFADPKFAFTTRGYRNWGHSLSTSTDLPEIAKRVAGYLPDTIKLPWGPETVDALKGELFPLVRSGSLLSAYVVERFERVFGTNISLWETAITLAEAWNGSFTELLEAAFLTTGELPPGMDMLSPVPDEPIHSFGQMELGLPLEEEI